MHLTRYMKIELATKRVTLQKSKEEEDGKNILFMKITSVDKWDVLANDPKEGGHDGTDEFKHKFTLTTEERPYIFYARNEME